MKSIFPIFKNLQATSIFKAFVINGIVAAIIATVTIELRFRLNDEKSDYYAFTQRLFNRKKLSNFHKILVVFVSSFLISFIVYHIMLFFFAYGGGMLTTKVFNKVSYLQYVDDLV